MTRRGMAAAIGVLLALAAPIATGVGAAKNPADEAPATVAGRDLAGWLADVEHDDRVVRLRAIRSLSIFGAPAARVLSDALASDDAAVRYLAAVQLGRIGGLPLRAAADRLQSLRENDRQPNVQIAAAYALCRAGKEAGNLNLLIDRLRDGEPAMACAAAELLGQLGPAAKAAVPALQQMLDDLSPDGHSPDDQDADHRAAAARSALRKLQSDAAQEGR